MNNHLTTSLNELTAIQRKAVKWGKRALLVLAGPGSGKTRVLTCRIARLLDESRNESFRVLALTFTNKAADEMKDRVRSYVPNLTDRVRIFTFHSFCSQVLRQHGAHIGLKPSFRIYSQLTDRQALLHDAIRNDSDLSNSEPHKLLPLIDRLKSQLISPNEATSYLEQSGWLTHKYPQFITKAYGLYERELRRANALDFHSLIFEAHKLFNFPVFCQHYQNLYKYWLIDEFQDTNDAQYKLLQRMASTSFREIFAVADDDQTIYEWNGANVQRISTLVSDFACEVIQLPTNFRCPPKIVDAANRLVVFNTQRSRDRHPSTPVHRELIKTTEPIKYLVFDSDQEEVSGIANEISNMDDAERTQTVVLARSRSLLQSIHDCLEEMCVRSAMLIRRDDFISPLMRWLIACLRQLDRPLDLHNLASLVSTFEKISLTSFSFQDIVSRSDISGISYLSSWTESALKTSLPPHVMDCVKVISGLKDRSWKLSEAINKLIKQFRNETDDPDLQEDLGAWDELCRKVDIPPTFGSLGQFLQGFDLRSKEPIPKLGAVSLATIHGAKGLEFDTVYLMGLAEEVLPSWHSIQNTNGKAALEEERRACFVAITQTKERLVLSRAQQYNGYTKAPSRFLNEMGMRDSITTAPLNSPAEEFV